VSIEENKAVDRRYVEEVLNRGRLQAVDELCTPDYVGHVPGFLPTDREGDKRLVGMLRAAFPDMRCAIQDQVAEGDEVLHRLVCRGTHTGELLGVPPSGRPVEVTGMNVNRIVDGKLVESWGVIDMLGLMQQVGAVPAPDGAAGPPPERPTTADAPEPRGATGTPEENKAVCRRFFAALDANDLGALEREVLAPGYRLRFDGMPELDRAGAVGVFDAFLAAFPGLRHDVEDQIAEGDRVGNRIVVRGTQRAEFMGIPPTGREVRIEAINVHRIAGGKVVEQWINSDALGMLQQLGVAPHPGQSGG
jgi:predicted ester cyclase